MGAEESDEETEPGEDRGPLAIDPPSHFTITGRRDIEMDAIGWVIFLLLLVLVLPLLPFLAVLVALTRLAGWGRPRAVSWG